MILTLIGLILLTFLIIYYLFPHLLFSPNAPAKDPHQTKYSYYQIIDQSNGKTLTYVGSGPISVGDEFISENNHRFIIVRVKGNKGFAQYVGKADMPK